MLLALPIFRRNAPQPAEEPYSTGQTLLSRDIRMRCVGQGGVNEDRRTTNDTPNPRGEHVSPLDAELSHNQDGENVLVGRGRKSSGSWFLVLGWFAGHAQNADDSIGLTVCPKTIKKRSVLEACLTLLLCG